LVDCLFRVDGEIGNRGQVVKELQVKLLKIESITVLKKKFIILLQVSISELLFLQNGFFPPNCSGVHLIPYFMDEERK
jgi:hypothetical protein